MRNGYNASVIDSAGALEDLKVPPANRLEKLHGNREGQYSIRINDQFRICFTFDSGGSGDVMEPMGISAYKLAQDIHVPTSRIQDILHSRRKVTADT
jgi:hypothetical protein